ncbi:hypothetical protein [Novispirillum itersonii]|uniref:Uncharacterized protein n=1 Tax=Novispirillum itersonii TaxID=189 RepID=A0A7W9ZHB0_NOVIT|nr:hypothetical protein [Novispirillum itersonii]MBB6210627.1 hypothetical protein [Novispirillum itersonii]
MLHAIEDFLAHAIALKADAAEMSDDLATRLEQEDDGRFRGGRNRTCFHARPTAGVLPEQ